MICLRCGSNHIQEIRSKYFCTICGTLLESCCEGSGPNNCLNSSLEEEKEDKDDG